MATTSKDTIYIDIDDEITSIIEKLRASEHKIVALVLPKRATMLQSSVNMKLLKRAAESTQKHLVLITSEAGLLPLAAAAGLYVAKTLQSKPEVPDVAAEAEDVAPAEKLDSDQIEPDDTEADTDFDSQASSDKPIGELAGIAAADKAEETIELDNTEPEKATALTKADKKAAKKDKKKAGLSPKVPNFEKFRIRLIIGAILFILLIVGWIVAATVLPKATITVDTDTSSVNSNLAINFDTAAKAVDITKLVVPAKAQQTQKTSSQQVPATGQKNEGNKASGSVSMSAGACSANIPSDVPAGSGLSSSGLTFITQQDTSFVPVSSHGKCTFQSNNNTPVTSQGGGSQYNIGPSNFTVAGRSDVSAASGSAMTGGTDNNIKVITQNDIDGAKQKLATQDANAVKTELTSALQTASYTAVSATFNPGTPAVTTSGNVGDQADTVTVSAVTTFGMFGVKQADLQKLIDADITKHIDPTKQAILDDGISKVAFTLISQSASTAQLTMQTTATAGPHLDVNSLIKQIAGKKSGEIKTIIGANPGVTNVDVHFSPFWVDSTPKKTSRVLIQFVKTTQSNANGN